MMEEKTESEKIKDLRLKGKLSESERRVIEALKITPRSLVLLKEAYHVYSMTNQWEKSMGIVEQLLSIEPEKGIYYAKKGRCLLHLGNVSDAKKTYIHAVSLLSGYQLDELIIKLERELGEKINVDPSCISSTYELYEGKNNLGIVKHNSIQGTIYFTKIVQSHGGKEIKFYEKVLPQCKELKEYIPEYVCSTKFNDVQMLTVKYIDSKPDNAEQIRVFAKNYYKALTGINASVNQEIENQQTKKKKLIRIGEKRSQGLVRFFSEIHEEKMNIHLFDLVHQRLKSKSYSRITEEVFRELEELVLKNKIYKAVNPERDYSLIHGDLGPHNLVMDKKKQRVFLVDWNTYDSGPISYDFAYLSVKAKDSGDYYPLLNSVIDKIIYEYARIMISFFGKSRKKFESAYLEQSINGLERIREQALALAGEKTEKKAKKRPYYLPNNLLFTSLRKEESTADILHKAYRINYLSKPQSSKRLIFMILKDVVQSLWEIPKSVKKQKLNGLDFYCAFYLNFFFGVDSRNYRIQDFSEKKLRCNGRSFITKEEWKYGIYDILTLYGRRRWGEDFISLGDKAAFYEFMTEKGISTVPILSEITPLTENNPLADLKKEDFFIKPRRENEGEGAELWCWNQETKRFENELYGSLDESRLLYHLKNKAKNHFSESILVQPVIGTHSDLSFLRIRATPTIRVLTYICPETEKVLIGESMIRYTMNPDSIVDNANKGGRVAPVNERTGKLGTPRSSNPMERDLDLVEREKVKNLTLPFWDECKNMVVQAHQSLRYRLVIGWDLLITDEGPLLLEGNSQAGLCFLQRAHRMQVSDTEMGKALAVHANKAMDWLYSLEEFTKNRESEMWKTYFGLNKKNCRLNISGEVQGVGYRKWANKKLQSLRIQGTAKNLEGGSVEINAKGNPFNLQRLYHECHFGPAKAKVNAVEIVYVKEL